MQMGVDRLVHVSTIEAVVVDEQPLVDADETRPIPETHPGLYGWRGRSRRRKARRAPSGRRLSARSPISQTGGARHAGALHSQALRSPTECSKHQSPRLIPVESNRSVR